MALLFNCQLSLLRLATCLNHLAGGDPNSSMTLVIKFIELSICKAEVKVKSPKSWSSRVWNFVPMHHPWASMSLKNTLYEDLEKHLPVVRKGTLNGYLPIWNEWFILLCESEFNVLLSVFWNVASLTVLHVLRFYFTLKSKLYSFLALISLLPHWKGWVLASRSMISWPLLSSPMSNFSISWHGVLGCPYCR